MGIDTRFASRWLFVLVVDLLGLSALERRPRNYKQLHQQTSQTNVYLSPLDEHTRMIYNVLTRCFCVCHGHKESSEQHRRNSAAPLVAAPSLAVQILQMRWESFLGQNEWHFKDILRSLDVKWQKPYSNSMRQNLWQEIKIREGKPCGTSP